MLTLNSYNSLLMGPWIFYAFLYWWRARSSSGEKKQTHTRRLFMPMLVANNLMRTRQNSPLCGARILQELYCARGTVLVLDLALQHVLSRAEANRWKGLFGKSNLIKKNVMKKTSKTWIYIYCKLKYDFVYCWHFCYFKIIPQHSFKWKRGFMLWP